MKINEKISYLRKLKNITQGQLAVKLDISRQAVYKWEAGESLPELDKIHKLSVIFGVSSDFLIDDSLAISDLESYTTSSWQENKKKTRLSKRLTITLTSFFAVFAIATVICLSFVLVKLYNGSDSYSQGAQSDTYLVTFGLPNDTIISSQMVKNGEAPRLPTAPVLVGQEFQGWYLNGKPYKGEKITERAYIYAKYSVISYTIAYNLKGGTLDYRAETSYSVLDKEITLIEPKKQGYTFLGWLYNGKTIDKIDTSIASDIFLEASWEITNYKISYKLNGGENNISNPSTFTMEQDVMFKAPTNDGLIFEGWYLDERFTTPIYEIGASEIFEDITIYAKWKMPGFEFEKLSATNGYALTKFEDTNATECVIPSKFCGLPVTLVYATAFSKCNNLEKIHISRNVSSISNISSDMLASLKEIIVDENNVSFSSENGVLFDFDKTTLILYPRSKESTSYEIPSTVNTISNYAFNGASNLTKITASNALTTIGAGAFNSASALTTFDARNAVIDLIDRAAFYGCSMLSEFKVDKIIAIESYAFYNCKSLEGFHFGTSIKSIGEYSFFGCSKIEYATFSSGISTIGANAFENCISIRALRIQSHCSSIGQYAFKGCTALSSINLPYGFKRIESYTFLGCTSLASISLFDTIDFVGAGAFLGCDSLSSVEINKDMNWTISYKQGKGEKTRLTIAERSTPSSVASIFKSDINADFVALAPEYVTITYLSEYGNIQNSTVKIEKGEICENHPFLIHDNYAFCGWVFENNPDRVVGNMSSDPLDFSICFAEQLSFECTNDVVLRACWEEISACDDGASHIFGEPYLSQPSCTENGLRLRDCEKCGKTLKELYKERLGHLLTNKYVDLGTTLSYHCQRCNYISPYSQIYNKSDSVYNSASNIMIEGASTSDISILNNGIYDESNDSAIFTNGEGESIVIALESDSRLNLYIGERICIKGRGDATFKVYIKYSGEDDYSLAFSGSLLSDEENESEKRVIPFYNISNMPYQDDDFFDEFADDDIKESIDDVLEVPEKDILGVKIVIENPDQNDFLEEISFFGNIISE
ncbi:MAG: leucine-rich repeat protein [Clostridia bacterium]|nr:leucine-rich repeat protein [Clostridia bacterium]